LRRGCEFEDLAQSDYIVNQKTARNKSSLVCGYELRKKAKEAIVENLGQELVIDVQKCNEPPIGNFQGISFPFVDGCDNSFFELLWDERVTQKLVENASEQRD
jgi:hypothetical protein